MKRFIKGFDPMTYESNETDFKPIVKKISVNSIREQPKQKFKKVMDT